MKLTKAEIKQAVDTFKEVTVKHELLNSTFELVMFMLELSPNCDIVNLVGPTGVGKSLLQSQVLAHVYAEERGRTEADLNYVPIIRTLASAAGHRLFDWKSLYRGALVELGDPFAQNRKALPGSTKGAPIFAYAGESRTASELRMYLEAEFRKRGTKFWIIDEAQHLVFGGRTGKAGHQFDVLKSIAQSAGVKLLLAGPHEMEQGLGSSGQLARRSFTVHFPRYRTTELGQVKEFAAVAFTFFKKMNVAGFPSVRENAPFLYSGSAGCVGILKDWLAKAYGLALRDQAEAQLAIVTLDHLRETRLSPGSMQAIMNDIRMEEELHQRSATDAEYDKIVAGLAAVGLPGESLLGRGGKSRVPPSRRVGLRATHVRDPVPTAAPAQGLDEVAAEAERV